MSKKGFLLHGTYLQETLQILTYVFNWLYFTQCLSSFPSISHLLHLCVWFLILFHLTQMMFSSIIRTGLPILVELIDLVNSVIIFLSQMTLLRWLTFLLGSQTVILIVLLFWIYLFLLMLVFVLQWLSLHWKILIMLFSQFPLTFHQIHNGMPRFIAQLMIILMLIGKVFVIISEMLHGKISLNSLLLLLVNFVDRSRLGLVYISLIENIRSSLTHLHGFQLLLLLPQFIEITFFVCTKRINLLILK